jgi:hypothetical protein
VYTNQDNYLGFTTVPLGSLFVIVPETMTRIILPFGGHRRDGMAEAVIAGGVVSFPP